MKKGSYPNEIPFFSKLRTSPIPPLPKFCQYHNCFYMRTTTEIGISQYMYIPVQNFTPPTYSNKSLTQTVKFWQLPVCIIVIYETSVL